MGLSFCSEAPRDKLWLYHGDFSGSDICNDEPGVCVDQNFMKNKSQNEAHEEDDVDYNNEKESTDFAIRRMLKTTALRPRLNITSKSETVLRHKDFQRELPLRWKMMERRRNPDHNEFVEGKHEAKLYMNALQDSSMTEITLTYENSKSMLEKGNEIHEEVMRQGKLVKQANRDTKITEKDMNDTSHRLKGMKCLRGKFKNIIWHNYEDPEGVAVPEYDDDPVTFDRSSSLPERLPSYHTKMTKQEWINKGVDQLCHVLEEVEHRQRDIGKELGEQEKHLQCLDHNIDHIEYKIYHQAKIMSSITKK